MAEKTNATKNEHDTARHVTYGRRVRDSKARMLQYMYGLTHACIYGCMYVCMYVCMYMYVCICMYVYVCMYVQLYKYMYVQLYNVYMYCVCSYICMHV